MSNLKLSDIQTAVDEKYADFVIEADLNETGEVKVLSFAPVLRLKKEDRTAMAKAVDIRARFSEENDEDIVDVMSDAFRITARKPAHFTELKKWAADDPAKWLYLFEQYQEKTSAGEASPSGS